MKTWILCAGRWYGGTSRITHTWNGRRFVRLLNTSRSETAPYGAWSGKKTSKDAKQYRTQNAAMSSHDRSGLPSPKGTSWVSAWTPLGIENVGIAVV